MGAAEDYQDGDAMWDDSPDDMGKRGAGGRPNTLPPAWDELAKAFGGVEGLAEALQVSPMTVWRWGKGRPPSGPARVAIDALARKKRLPNPLLVSGEMPSVRIKNATIVPPADGKEEK